MVYRFDLHSVPSRVDSGEEFNPQVEVCCDDPDGCSNDEVKWFLEGNLIGHESMAFTRDFCSDRDTGTAASTTLQDEIDNTPSWYDISRSGLIIYEPGTYTISTDKGQSDTVTVEEVDPSFSIISCDVSPSEVMVGEDIDVSVSVENTGGAGEVDLVISDQGGEITSENLYISQNGIEDLDISLVYDDAGEYEISADLV